MKTNSEMEIKIDYTKAFNYARMQNGVPLVRSVVLRNNSTEPLRDIRLSVDFDPAFSDGFETAVTELPPKKRLILDNINILPSASFLANLTEDMQVTMTVTCCSKDAVVLASEERAIKLSTYDTWEGEYDAPEMLAAFVLPNHPAIDPVLQTAAGKLQKWTGTPSLDGYQSGNPDRAKMQMAAVYDSLREMSIVYANPPASFAEKGQRIRLPEEIFTSRLATCLDAALLYSGCLEAIGLHPLVVIHSGHAYAGCWLTETSSPYPVNDDASVLHKRSADGINAAILVETTGFLKGHGHTFEEAVAMAGATILNDEDFHFFVDVTSARNCGILPIPQRILTKDGYVIDQGTVPRVSARPERVGDTDDIDINGVPKVDKHTIWERKLLDLTLRNNLINIHTKRGAVQLMGTEPDTTVDLLESGVEFNLFGMPPEMVPEKRFDGLFKELPQDSPLFNYAGKELESHRFHSFLDEEETQARLANIRKEARHFLEESGANTFYLAVGALKWYGDDKALPHFAPIILIPVEITRNTKGIRWTGEDITANLTLLEMLRQQHELSIPGLENLPEKDGYIAVRKVLNTVRHAVMDKKGWDVEDLMFLGNFTFNKFIIWNDIHTHRDMLDANTAVSSLVEKRLKVRDIVVPERSVDELCPSAGILQPISADSSQLRAIRDAVAGRSFVMHGPPGTGKSQTITNIIANQLYNGKRVLFVSEKKAALEVVQKRLESIGLDPFCLELHSNKARKSEVLSKFEKILEIKPEPAPESFAEDAQRMDRERSLLDNHAEAVNRVYPSGLSLYDCVSRYLLLPEELDARRIPEAVIAGLKEGGLKEMQSAVKDYISAIAITGIDSSCKLFDLPVVDYSAELKERMSNRFSKILGKKGLAFWWEARKLERETGRPIGVKLSSEALQSVREKISRWLDNAHQMKMYAIYSRQRAALCALGLSFISDEFESGRLDKDDIGDFFHKSLYRSYANYILANEKGLGIFCGDLFESLIAKFREDDAAFREVVRREIVARLSSRLPGPDDHVSQGPEMAILKRAIRNNSRGVSLRKLFDRIPNLLPRLCPCMLMSPLSVSQYLQPEEGMFDLVIFDEASQLPTSEAVAAIARGKSLIVVGDPKQLPPTSFFESDAFDEDNPDQEDMESILDDCIALSFPSAHLKWHYRSRHESLIAFSNANYYDNSLLTFPSNDDISTKVTFHQVDGTYDRGRSRTNEAEAEAIVQEIKLRLSDPEAHKSSIGIVTFNVSQKNLIEQKIENMLAKNRILARVAADQQEPLFVKSLENVQGDERDVIIFSVGYGTDSKGRVSMNFGPLNQKGGWRRLNVAVSRARKEMMVFSSLLPEQIASDWYVPRGVADFRAFLKYARDGRESLDVVKDADSGDNLFAEIIAEELRAQGKTVHTNIGSSDFKIDVGVVDPDRPGCYLYGILLDGPGYLSAEAARDREVIRPQVLEGLGWNIVNKWILDRYDD